jgi:hypothetical protein
MFCKKFGWKEGFYKEKNNWICENRRKDLSYWNVRNKMQIDLSMLRKKIWFVFV